MARIDPDCLRFNYEDFAAYKRIANPAQTEDEIRVDFEAFKAQYATLANLINTADDVASALEAVEGEQVVRDVAQKNAARIKELSSDILDLLREPMPQAPSEEQVEVFNDRQVTARNKQDELASLLEQSEPLMEQQGLKGFLQAILVTASNVAADSKNPKTAVTAFLADVLGDFAKTPMAKRAATIMAKAAVSDKGKVGKGEASKIIKAVNDIGDIDQRSAIYKPLMDRYRSIQDRIGGFVPDTLLSVADEADATAPRKDILKEHKQYEKQLKDLLKQLAFTDKNLQERKERLERMEGYRKTLKSFLATIQKLPKKALSFNASNLIGIANKVNNASTDRGFLSAVKQLIKLKATIDTARSKFVIDQMADTVKSISAGGIVNDAARDRIKAAFPNYGMMPRAFKGLTEYSSNPNVAAFMKASAKLLGDISVARRSGADVTVQSEAIASAFERFAQGSSLVETRRVPNRELMALAAKHRQVSERREAHKNALEQLATADYTSVFFDNTISFLRRELGLTEDQVLTPEMLRVFDDESMENRDVLKERLESFISDSDLLSSAAESKGVDVGDLASRVVDSLTILGTPSEIYDSIKGLAADQKAQTMRDVGAVMDPRNMFGALTDSESMRVFQEAAIKEKKIYRGMSAAAIKTVLDSLKVVEDNSDVEIAAIDEMVSGEGDKNRLSVLFDSLDGISSYPAGAEKPNNLFNKDQIREGVFYLKRKSDKKEPYRSLFGKGGLFAPDSPFMEGESISREDLSANQKEALNAIKDGALLSQVIDGVREARKSVPEGELNAIRKALKGLFTGIEKARNMITILSAGTTTIIADTLLSRANNQPIRGLAVIKTTTSLMTRLLKASARSAVELQTAMGFTSLRRASAIADKKSTDIVSKLHDRHSKMKGSTQTRIGLLLQLDQTDRSRETGQEVSEQDSNLLRSLWLANQLVATYKAEVQTQAQELMGLFSVTMDDLNAVGLNDATTNKRLATNALRDIIAERNPDVLARIREAITEEDPSINIDEELEAFRSPFAEIRPMIAIAYEKENGYRPMPEIENYFPRIKQNATRPSQEVRVGIDNIRKLFAKDVIDQSYLKDRSLETAGLNGEAYYEVDPMAVVRRRLPFSVRLAYTLPFVTKPIIATTNKNWLDNLLREEGLVKSGTLLSSDPVQLIQDHFLAQLEILLGENVYSGNIESAKTSTAIGKMAQKAQKAFIQAKLFSARMFGLQFIDGAFNALITAGQNPTAVGPNISKANAIIFNSDQRAAFAAAIPSLNVTESEYKGGLTGDALRDVSKYRTLKNATSVQETVAEVLSKPSNVMFTALRKMELGFKIAIGMSEISNQVAAKFGVSPSGVDVVFDADGMQIQYVDKDGITQTPSQSEQLSIYGLVDQAVKDRLGATSRGALPPIYSLRARSDFATIIFRGLLVFRSIVSVLADGASASVDSLVSLGKGEIDMTDSEIRRHVTNILSAYALQPIVWGIGSTVFSFYLDELGCYIKRQMGYDCEDEDETLEDVFAERMSPGSIAAMMALTSLTASSDAFADFLLSNSINGIATKLDYERPLPAYMQKMPQPLISAFVSDIVRHGETAITSDSLIAANPSNIALALIGILNMTGTIPNDAYKLLEQINRGAKKEFSKTRLEGAVRFMRSKNREAIEEIEEKIREFEEKLGKTIPEMSQQELASEIDGIVDNLVMPSIQKAQSAKASYFQETFPKSILAMWFAEMRMGDISQEQIEAVNNPLLSERDRVNIRLQIYTDRMVEAFAKLDELEEAKEITATQKGLVRKDMESVARSFRSSFKPPSRQVIKRKMLGGKEELRTLTQGLELD